MVTQSRDFVIESPLDIESSIAKFKSGQVYEVLQKDQMGNFQPFIRNNHWQVQSKMKVDEFDGLLQSYGQPSASKSRISLLTDGEAKEEDENVQVQKFLVYIVNQEIEFNEQPVTITFFKDITFCVLYEQIKAQDELQGVITNNLDKKIGQKLKMISGNVKKLMGEQQLIDFEKTYTNTIGIR